MLSTRLTFLGILIDTDHQRLELPAEKLQRLRAMSQSWPRRKVYRKCELHVLSFLGHLHYAATVVHPSRIFNHSQIKVPPPLYMTQRDDVGRIPATMERL